jgi:macrolide transport system ATP-binding/permease protein
VPNVAAAMPYLSTSVTVRAGNVQHRTALAAVGSNFTNILKWRVERGRFFTSDEERRLATVAVLGQKLARRLFRAGQDPLRRFVLVDNVPFQVVGVLEGKGALTGNADDDDTIVMPFSSGSTRVLGTPYLSWISVAVADGRRAAETSESIKAVLREAHRQEDVEIFNKAAAVAAERATVDAMTSMLLVTAIISLIVGGIGVMNVMLMTVTERTSEIGIRMAVGASRFDVLLQFLVEAIVLSSIGGVLGLGLGWATGTLCRMLGEHVIFTPTGPVLGLFCAVATGLLCGVLPARRAAGLDPVAALARR